MDYILDTTPLVMDTINYDKIKGIEDKIKNKEDISLEEARYFLDYVVYVTRCKVVKDFNETFLYKCDLAQSIMTYYLRSLDIKTNPNSTLESISEGIMGHNFNVVTLNVDGKGMNFIVDATYRQFFLKENACEEKMFIHNGLILIAAHPGYFIKEKDYPIVKDFLYHGYMEMDERNTKIYGDSFFKTKTGIKKEDIPLYQLPGNSYIKLFLRGNVKLSKSEDELRSKGLLISSSNDEVKKGI